MAILSENTWDRHTNPWSGWSRVLSMPGLALGLYLHNFWIIGVVVIWLFINPVLFRKPASVNNWMSKGVMGERIYFKDGKKLKKDLPTLLNVLNVPVFIVFLYFGWQQDLSALVMSGLLVMTIKFWFIDKMVAITDSKLP